MRQIFGRAHQSERNRILVPTSPIVNNYECKLYYYQLC
jgi:hypothetical protein